MSQMIVGWFLAVSVPVLAGQGAVEAPNQPVPGFGGPSVMAPLRQALTPARINSVEDGALLRHYEKLLDMKWDLELQLELARLDTGDKHPEVARMESRLQVVTKRIQSLKQMIETKMEKDREKREKNLDRPRGVPGAPPVIPSVNDRFRS